ncbi:2-hydroxy-acid oxidase [Komagataeibacter nataicola]|nr:FAD-linked oxidase C-terminal domain-containing protein [Komagataeibacter nataicola]AQU88732.1 2-hydroxy-acid oxidase [Komagataeibacter nataicola]WEQ57015.1 FAD-linked oxidase C-terminal domain-containing protein [Komagataeibacter nataicola]WNM08541.1 FAD-linked oxidase C-terminal domain-containing protein [Komagataeibacter nataicola]
MTTADRIEQAIAELLPHFGDRLSRSQSVCEHHGHGEGYHAQHAPQAVIFAETTEDVAHALRVCNTHRAPVIPFGAGTSLEGQVNAIEGGISIDLSRMTGLLELNTGDMDCRVQAGITRQDLNLLLRDEGLFFPVDPGGEATIGGMCATRASGTGAVRYGTIRENVLGLTVVLADGRIMRVGRRVRKSAMGYDLTHLMIGSEGTLGIITEVQLRLHGIPETMAAAVCQFETLADCVETAVQVMQMSVPIGRMELLDDVQMDACIRYAKLEGYRPIPTMFFEFEGGPEAVREQIATVEAIADDNNGSAFTWSTQAQERAALWKTRHAVFWACLAYRPGYTGISTDAIVPISALTDMILGAKHDIEESGITAPIVGHIGDGNFHTVMLVPPDEAEVEKARVLDHKIIARALSLGGSASGEHGVGLAKIGFMPAEHDAVALDVMRTIKLALDPNNILNPGKLLPPPAPPC